jgi:DNA polymerase IV
VWGFGSNTVSLLEKYGLRTAYDFVMRPEGWAANLLHKPGREIWNELRGNPVWKVDPEAKTAYATIMKSKTFTPPTGDREYVYARLVRNAESAFQKARRYRLRAGMIGVVLRRADFHHDGMEVRLVRPTSSVLEAMPLVRGLFERVFQPGKEYRSTLVLLGKLQSDGAEQYELFEDRPKIENLRHATLAMDAINRRYGKHTVCCGTSLDMNRKPGSARDAKPARLESPLRGENSRQRLAIPRFAVQV